MTDTKGWRKEGVHLDSPHPLRGYALVVPEDLTPKSFVRPLRIRMPEFVIDLILTALSKHEAHSKGMALLAGEIADLRDNERKLLTQLEQLRAERDDYKARNQAEYYRNEELNEQLGPLATTNAALQKEVEHWKGHYSPPYQALADTNAALREALAVTEPLLTDLYRQAVVVENGMNVCKLCGAKTVNRTTPEEEHAGGCVMQDVIVWLARADAALAATTPEPATAEDN